MKLVALSNNLALSNFKIQPDYVCDLNYYHPH